MRSPSSPPELLRSAMSDESLVASIGLLDDSAQNVLEIPEIAEIMLPMLRKDLCMGEEYLVEPNLLRGLFICTPPETIRNFSRLMQKVGNRTRFERIRYMSTRECIST